MMTGETALLLCLAAVSIVLFVVAYVLERKGYDQSVVTQLGEWGAVCAFLPVVMGVYFGMEALSQAYGLPRVR